MSDKMREALQALLDLAVNNEMTIESEFGSCRSREKMEAEKAWSDEIYAARAALAEQPAQGESDGWGLAAFQHKWEACETQCECKVCGTVFTAALSPPEKVHYNYLDNFCKHCGYDHSAGPLCNALKAERPAQGEADALDGMVGKAWRRFETALAQPEPVAWGMPNSAITGKKMALMMVRLDIPSDDQYGGAMWVPLYTAPPATSAPDVVALIRSGTLLRSRSGAIGWTFTRLHRSGQRESFWGKTPADAILAALVAAPKP